jgi:hypothetical protein
LRLDKPSHEAKYLSPKGSSAHLYVPLNAGPVSKEPVLCEGEFKALALLEGGIYAVGIGGFSSSMSQGELIPDLQKFFAKWKYVALLYFLGDADTVFKFDFSREAVKLAKALPEAIALSLPRIGLNCQNGIDDCRAALNSEFPAFWEQIKRGAVKVSSKTDVSTLAVKLLVPELPAVRQLPGWQDEIRPKIVSLATHLDPLPLDDLAHAVREHLDIKVSVFKEQASKTAASAAKEEARKTESPTPNLPEDYIILPSGTLGIYEAAKRTFEILARAQEIFLRGDKVFEVFSDPEQDGILALRIVSEQAFRSRIELYAKVMAWRASPHGGYLLKPDARCSYDNAAAMLACNAKTGLPAIAAVHRCPILVESEDSENKIAVLEKGYYPVHGGRLISAGVKPHKISLSEAVELLLDLFSEYEFLSASDKSRAVAALISPAFKFGELLPTHFLVFVVEADDSQAGKGFLLELIQTTYNEKPSLVSQRKGGVGSLDESISSAHINGRPFIQLDNIRGSIDSQSLEMATTCPYGGTVPARVPYRGEVQIRADRYIYQLSSNGFQSTRDFANRSCIIRIKKRRDVAFRSFPEGDLLAHVAANQPKYLGAVFCVVTQWILYAKQRSTDLRGEGRGSRDRRGSRHGHRYGASERTRLE